MRALLLAGAALFAVPAAAQDHSGHDGHDEPVQEEQDHAAHQGMDHSAHGQMDHSQHAMEQQEEPALDHSQMDHSQMDHGTMDHGEMDHSQMDHGTMDHGGMDHSQMDHGTMDHGGMDHSQMDHGSMDIPTGPPPPRAFEGPAHAADLFFDEQRMAAARAYNHVSHGNMTTGMVFVERLEARLSEGHDAYLWDASVWYGTSLNKAVFKTEGEGEFGNGGEIEDAEMQLLWGRAIGPFIDLQAGVRLDVEPDTTAHLALGAAGLAPYMIHFDAAAFLSDEGDLTARIEAEHDMKLTQRLILQPRVEAELSAQDIPERGVGAGLSKIEVGARLRYEFVPEFAPYIGVEYEAATGRTADFIRDAGDDPDGVAVVAGLRFWF
ncbi:copper resistance protein B [Aurantiacibacter hainanensis]|uniref:copper resistance protein B n=1 Tax=Aurantiacibacter hainanensis TaxID=3076114 RepID=UPI0030C74560